MRRGACLMDTSEGKKKLFLPRLNHPIFSNSPALSHDFFFGWFEIRNPTHMH